MLRYNLNRPNRMIMVKQDFATKLQMVLSSCSSPKHKEYFTVAAIGHFVPFIRLVNMNILIHL